MDVISYVLAKAYTDKAIAEAGQIGFNVVIVEELPLIGQPKTIYLKHRSDGQYEEWMYVSNAWRKIGVDIDLSGYATKEDLQELTTSVEQQIEDIQIDLQEITTYVEQQIEDIHVDLQELTASVDQKIKDIQDDLVDNYVQADQIATDSVLGLVKSSTDLNGVAVNDDGTMSINSVGVDKLENVDGTEFILNCNE